VWAFTNAPLDALSFPDPGLALAFPLVRRVRHLLDRSPPEVKP